MSEDQEVKKEENIEKQTGHIKNASVLGKTAIAVSDSSDARDVSDSSDARDVSDSSDARDVSDSSDASHKIIKASDIILLVVVLLIALIGIIYIMSTKKPGSKVVISIDGEVVEKFELSKDYEYQVVTDYGNNLVEINAGKVDITVADCPDKVCVNHVPIENVGETIICLPHKLVVEIVE